MKDKCFECFLSNFKYHATIQQNHATIQVEALWFPMSREPRMSHFAHGDNFEIHNSELSPWSLLFHWKIIIIIYIADLVQLFTFYFSVLKNE